MQIILNVREECSPRASTSAKRAERGVSTETILLINLD